MKVLEDRALGFRTYPQAEAEWERGSQKVSEQGCSVRQGCWGMWIPQHVEVGGREPETRTRVPVRRQVQQPPHSETLVANKEV